MSKTINEIIEKLAQIGDKYLKPQKGWGIFSNHTHLEQARQLQLLRHTTAQKDSDEQVSQVTKVVAEIYYSISKPRTLIADIHQCLSSGTNFEAYSKAVNASSFEKMKTESYDVLPNMTDYRRAIDPTGQYAPPPPVYAEPSYTS